MKFKSVSEVSTKLSILAKKKSKAGDFSPACRSLRKGGHDAIDERNAAFVGAGRRFQRTE